MAKIYIEDIDTVINTDHIVMAEFEPAHIREAGVDEYGCEYGEKLILAEVKLTLTSIELEESYSYGGDVKGTASQSVVKTLTGSTAEGFWMWYVDSCDATILPEGIPIYREVCDEG